MKNLIKISLVTSLILSTNLFAWSEAETEQRVNTIGTNSFNNTSKVESIEKSINTSITDTFEPITKAYYGEYQTSYEPSTDSEIATITKKGLSEEIYGSYNYTHDLNSGTITKTQVEKGLLERVSELESNSGGSVDLTAVNNNINQNTTLATDARDRAITANTKADNAISQNTTQDSQISNLTSSKADKSEVVLVNNKVNSNTQRLDQKDIKDSEQDTQINSNTNRITVVEHNVSTLISNSNSQVNSRLDNQDRKISALEKELAKTDKRENKKIASGMATNLNFDFTNGNRSFAFNHSNFNGENALGVGFAYRKNGTTISISLGTDFENVGVKTQATFSF